MKSKKKYITEVKKKDTDDMRKTASIVYYKGYGYYKVSDGRYVILDKRGWEMEEVLGTAKDVKEYIDDLLPENYSHKEEYKNYDD